HLILLTRPKGYRLRLEKRNLVACKVLKKKYPKLEKHFRNMYIKYNKAIEMCEKLEQEGKAIILRPTEETAVESFEKNVDKLRAGYENGYSLAMSRIEDIKKLFE
ncbi:MAG: DUF6363 domain-containing protein, partial [Sarcina sp.]